jgi:hypothetical protein
VAGLPMSVWEGIHTLPNLRETFDPFDAYIRKRLDENFARSVAAAADDPLLIGYFLGNEPQHEDVAKVVPTLNRNSACKWDLKGALEYKYGSVDAFNRAWGLQVTNFADLVDMGLPVTTPAAREDMRVYTEKFFTAYYRLMTETVRKYDRNHLLLGSRWQPHTADNEMLCRIAGQFMDVISVNYYTYGVDPAYLGRISRWSGGKPLFLSEFYWNSPRDSGLPGGVKDVRSQEERGLAYRNYVEQAAALDSVVGVEWYTLVDGAFTGFFYGKYNGENPNCGLIDVRDRPWKEMLGHMMKTNYRIYDVVAGTQAPYVYDDPRFKMTPK